MLTVFSGIGVILLGAAMTWTYLINQERFPPDVADPDALALPLPEEPSAIVLPFFSTSEVDRDVLIANRLAEEMTQSLGRLRDVFLISSETTARYRGAQFRIKQTAERLGVQYLISGSVNRNGAKYRIFYRVIDAFTGDVEWVEVFERNENGLVDVNDMALPEVLDTLDVSLDDEQRPRVFGLGTRNHEAWIGYAEAVAYRVPDDRESMANSLKRLRAAHALDPDWAAPSVEIAWTYRNAVEQGWTDLLPGGRAGLIDAALEFAEIAVEADPWDHRGVMEKARLLAMKGESDASLRAWRRAVILGPNHFVTHWGLAQALIARGDHAEALPLVERALRLHPRHPVALSQFLAELRHDAGRPALALDLLSKVIAKRPAAPEPRLMRAFIHGSLDQWQAARDDVRELLSLHPSFGFTDWSKRQRARGQPDREGWRHILKRAGVPE